VRVTDRMMFDLAARDGGAARQRVEEATSQSSSGVRVGHPGDDPGAAGLIALHRATADRLDAIRTVASRASDEVGAADTALSDLSNTLVRARELTVQLSNPGYSAAERAEGANEVRGLMSRAVAALNTKVGSRYVFGGRLDGAPPFDAAGNYSGDDGVRQVEIAPGVYQDASVRADVAVKGTGGGVDVFATLQGLADALAANDVTSVRGALDTLDASTTQVSTARSHLGEAMSAFDAAAAVSRTAADDARAQESRLADADPIEAASKLALAQRALEAALVSTAQGFKLSLANFL
jgi:flagellar hook-associated protein 3 FlgL